MTFDFRSVPRVGKLAVTFFPGLVEHSLRHFLEEQGITGWSIVSKRDALARFPDTKVPEDIRLYPGSPRVETQVRCLVSCYDPAAMYAEILKVNESPENKDWLNHIVTMGRLVRDPELRHTQSGIPVTSFTIACDRDYKGADGEKATDFLDIVAWRNTAEFVSQYFTKGRMAVIDGRLQLRDWTDRDGNRRRSAEILANSVHFGDRKPENQAAPRDYAAPAGVPAGGVDDLEAGGDLPF